MKPLKVIDVFSIERLSPTVLGGDLAGERTGVNRPLHNLETQHINGCEERKTSPYVVPP